MPATYRRGVTAVLSVLAVSLMSTSLALATSAPVATTAPATNITSTTATLNGIVVPNKSSTTYYFQYGITTNYTSKTDVGTANGNASKTVSAAVTGLTREYDVSLPPRRHQRGGLVLWRRRDVHHRGRRIGWIEQGLGQHQLDSTHDHVGSHGHHRRRGHRAAKAGQTVTLKANPYPYTAGFKPTGETTTTSPSGAYSLTVRPGRNTRYEVTVSTKVPVTSSPATVGVRVKVVIHVSTLRPFRGQLVRFYGTVTPAHNGRYAQIQRRTSTGAWRTVASTRLQAGGRVNGVAVSKYARRIRIQHSGTYRVRVNPRDGDHLSANSATRTEHVR